MTYEQLFVFVEGYQILNTEFLFSFIAKGCKQSTSPRIPYDCLSQIVIIS